MRLTCVAFVLGFLVADLGQAQNGPNRAEHIDSLIAASSASSFGHSLQGLNTAVTLAQARPPVLSAQQALRTLCERSFPPDSTQVHMRRAFEGRYNPAQFDLMLAWFGSELGRKVADAERSATALKDERRREVREKVRAQWMSGRRVLLLERLDGNLGLGSRQQTYALLLLEDLIAPQSRSEATDGRPSDVQVQSMLQAAAGRLESRLPDSLLLDLKVAYRSLSNDDLQRYNEFLESSAGRWYVQMMQQGLENSFLSGRERFAEGATAMPASSRKSFYP